MSNTWSREQIDALSPDASSLKAAQQLLSPSKWPSLGANEIALWGECQGSGKKPYLTRIDLSEPAFKCSCPSRKFPCKHGLALFHLYVQDASAFSASPPPDWVTEWLDSRRSRQEAKATKSDAPADPNAQAKRMVSREQKVQGGLTELSLWIHDLIRIGLAQVPNKPRGYFDDMAARLIDAQAPGLARRVRNLATLTTTQPDWTTQLACELGELQLIISTYSRQNDLPDEIRADVRSTVGWTENQQELMQQPGISDLWLVLAQELAQEEQLRVRKSWLWGKSSGRIGLILEFAHGKAAFPGLLAIGRKWLGELVFFPSNYPQRAAIKSQADGQTITQEDLNSLIGYITFDEMLGGYAAALAQNCWIEEFPFYLRQITPTITAENVRLVDQSGATLPLKSSFSDGWKLLAISGGHPVDLVGHWDGASLLPLAVWQDGLTRLGSEE